MPHQKTLIIGLIVLLITTLLVVGGALSKNQEMTLSPSLVPNAIIEVSSADFEVINGISVPPEPDPAVNNATLAGVDSNQNGVRDDVERSIVTSYPDSAKARAGLMQHAASLQKLLTEEHSVSERIAFMDDATACLSASFMSSAADVSGGKRAFDAAMSVEAIVLNTKQRVERYVLVNSSFGGTVTDSIPFDQGASRCIVDLNSTEVINGITVPPEPDPTVNNSTLAGVDSNNNGVRDDAERVIAKHSSNLTDFTKAMAYAKAYGKVLTLSEEIPRSMAVSIMSQIFCTRNLPGKIPDAIIKTGNDELIEVLFNNYERRGKLTRFNTILGGVDDEELSCSQSVESETINGITVPPEPDPAINNSTLPGVDVNNNGVRDDVERLIAQKFGNDTKRYTEAMAFSRYELSGMINQNQETSDAYGKAIDCTILTADEIDPITFAQLNTSERGKAYALANAGASGGSRDDCEGWENN